MAQSLQVSVFSSSDFHRVPVTIDIHSRIPSHLFDLNFERQSFGSDRSTVATYKLKISESYAKRMRGTTELNMTIGPLQLA
jgi:hypothetical protein